MAIGWLPAVTAGAAAASVLGMPALAQAKAIRIGASFDNSGVEKANGSGLFAGSSACINAINKAGGIHGSKIELVMADDQFKPEVAKSNALAFNADASVLAMLHPLGTRQTAEIMDAVPGLPVVGPNTGTVALRKKNAPNTFWVRANYDQEVDKLVSTAITLGTTQIALVHPKDPLGAGLLAAFNAACEKHRIKPTVIATTPSTISPEVEPAAKEIAKAAPQAVIMGLGAGTAPLFVRALRQAGATSTIYGLSIAMSAANIRDLGELSRGLGFSIVVPSPFATKHEIVRRYQADTVWELFLPALLRIARDERAPTQQREDANDVLGFLAEQWNLPDIDVFLYRHRLDNYARLRDAPAADTRATAAQRLAEAEARLARQLATY